MEQNHESSFWKSNMRAVPGRPSPKRDIKANKNNPSSFENYQQSVSDAWTLSEDELTKEYCILSPDESKLTSRRMPSGAPKFHHKNQLPVVHKATSLSSSSTSSILVTTTANNNLPPQAATSSSRSLSLDENNKPEITPPQPPSSSSSSSSVDHQHTSVATNEKPSNEYGFVQIIA